MKIYTRTGDKGSTSLFGGERVLKSAARINAYGTVDEANSLIGLARSSLADTQLDETLADIQNRLFDVGADLATPAGARQRKALALIDADDVGRLEALIDSFEAELEPLQQFIVPGGVPAAAALQVARAVLRRAERETVLLAQSEDVNPEVISFLNRLSDLLFTLARTVNQRMGVSEARWHVRGRQRE
jgi:cob(I)alamin adenosyltransferase